MAIARGTLEHQSFKGVPTGRSLAAVHPGSVLLADFIEPMGITRYRVAKAIGVPRRRIDEICAGERGITPDTAVWAWLSASSAGLGTYFSQCPWRNVVERLQDLWDKECKCLNPTVSRAEYEHRYGQCVQILLKLEVPIGSDEEIEPRCRQCQKLPVLDARPPGGPNCRDFVACEKRREVPW